MKRGVLFSFLIVAFVWMVFPSSVYAAYFSDVEGHWAKSYIDNVAEIGLVVGYPDGQFLPDEAISRGEFITILAQESGVELSETATFSGEFSDVTKEHWAYSYICWGKEQGILCGYEDGSFHPDRIISRQEMAVVLYRYLTEYRKTELLTMSPQVIFSDGNLIGDWALEAVTAMQRSGIINGRGNGIFDPLTGTTRAETAVMISNYIKFYRSDDVETASADIYFNGDRKAMNVPVVNADATLLLPARTLLEAAGYRVNYYAVSRLVVATRGDCDIEFWIGRIAYYRNGTIAYLSTAPQLINGTAYIPLTQLVFSATVSTAKSTTPEGAKEKIKVQIGDVASPIIRGENNFNGSGSGSNVNGTISMGAFLGSVSGGEMTYGCYTQENGAMLIGYWQNGMMNGTGRSITADGEFYVGTFQNGAKLTGITYFTNGSRFIGTWQKGSSGSVYPKKGQYIATDGTIYGTDATEWSGGALSKSKW